MDKMDDLKIGMIGLDTSHCPAFTKLLNNNSKGKWKKKKDSYVEGGQVVYAYPGGTKDFLNSYTRVEKFTKQVSKMGVDITNDLEYLAENSDAILLTSCDGRQHLEQFRVIAPFKKPVFFDKPFACSLEDANEIVSLSKKYECPIFSSSSLRYYSGISEHSLSKNEEKNKSITTLTVYGTIHILDDYPGYFWYGVHIAEIIYEILGVGCVDVHVTRVSDEVDEIISHWKEGKTVIIKGHHKGSSKWGAYIRDKDSVVEVIAKDNPPGYYLQLLEVMKFFKSKKSPVSDEEMVEVVAFLEACNKSRKTGKKINL